MTPERWEDIKNQTKKQFSVEAEGREDLVVQTADGSVKAGEAEFIIFESPLGRTKLQFQKKPKVEGKKFFYSHQQGAAARVEYKFSESELVYTFKVYKWDEVADAWREMDSASFG